MLSFILFACSSGSNNPTSPLPMDMIEVFFDVDEKAIELDLAKMKKEYSIGSVETVKVWDMNEDEEMEISFVALKKGKRKIGILAVGDADTDRKDLEQSAQERLDSSFTVPTIGNPRSLMMNDAAKAAGIVGITLEQCVSDWISDKTEIDSTRLEKQCDNFTSPNEEWYTYMKEKELTDLAERIQRMEENEVSESLIDPQKDYEKFIKKLSDEGYINSKLNTRINTVCLEVDLVTNDEYFFTSNVTSAIQECTEYITYLAEFQKEK